MVSGDSMLTVSSWPRLVLSLPVSLDARARLPCALLRIWCLPIALQKKKNNKKGPYESLNECVPLHSDNSKKEQALTFKNLSYRIIGNKNRRKKCLQFKTKLLGNRKHFSFEVNKVNKISPSDQKQWNILSECPELLFTTVDVSYKIQLFCLETLY